MRKYIYLLAFVLGTVSWVNAQDFGYLGKKNLISVSATGNFRVLPAVEEPIGLLDENGYRTVKYTNGFRDVGFKLFRWDARLGYTRLLNRGFGVGAEFGYEYYRMTTTNVVNATLPVFNVYSTMLTFSFHGRNTIAPTGFSTTVGIGPKTYAFNRSVDYQWDSLGVVVPMANPFPNYGTHMVGLNVFLELGQRFLIAEFMTIDIALRVNSGYVFYGGSLKDDPTAPDPYWTKADVHSEVMRENLGTLMTFKLGFSFML